MPLSPNKLNEHINRLLTLPFPGKDTQAIKVRGGEFSRVLKAGVTSDEALSAVVDDLVEHCEECPTPAAVMDAIRRHNADTLYRRRDRERDSERKEWPKLYGSPTAVLGDGCIECGKPWRDILREISGGHAEETRRAKEIVKAVSKPTKQDWEDAYERAAADLRATGVRWRHSETCLGRNAEVA